MPRLRYLPVLLWVLATPLYAADANNPYNSPIRNANPNSRQGTAPPPGVPRSALPPTRAPTVENRGIGNGENIRRAAPAPVTPTPPPKRQ
ncbi:hypothetical protein [Pseudomonas sp. NPDC007930]|uniref:hypothetical protein n=1 Tax=Pseudomonas sp. NPDC007930 TaxID=3364417 RepID=UPI0036E417A9